MSERSELRTFGWQQRVFISQLMEASETAFSSVFLFHERWHRIRCFSHFHLFLFVVSSLNLGPDPLSDMLNIDGVDKMSTVQASN